MSCKAREARAMGAYCSYVTEREAKRNTADRVFRTPPYRESFAIRASASSMRGAGTVRAMRM